jgi:hypothetical protein
MAVPANTVQRVTRVGVREELSNIISIIEPEETPFYSNTMSGESLGNFDFDWQTDALRAANGSNTVIDGDEFSIDPYPPTTRLKNYVQTMDEAIRLSDLTQKLNHAGGHVTMRVAMAKTSRQLKRDVETRLCGNFAAVPPAAGTGHQTAGAVAFSRQNAQRGATGTNATLSGGTSGYISAVGTPGTLRAFTKAQLDTAALALFNAGVTGDKMALMSGSLKQKFSGFIGLAQNRREAGDRPVTIIGAADIYLSDFGRIMAVPSVFTTGRDVLLYSKDNFKLRWLDPWNTVELGKTGHSEAKAMRCTFGLQCDNDKAVALIADVDPTL